MLQYIHIHRSTCVSVYIYMCIRIYIYVNTWGDAHKNRGTSTLLPLRGGGRG